ncbi:MAG: cysteine desulfurase-like protein [Thermoanaerobaculia bacterium]
MISLDSIRSQFPSLSRVHNGHPVTYFDAPGGTQVPRGVAEAMTDYLFHHNANTHWAYPTSEETDAVIAGAREAAADLLNARPDEIVFGANMTTLTFHLGRALGRMWSEGDEVIITELDHHANVAPWRALTTDRGVVVKSAKLNCEASQLDYDHLASLVTDRTKLIAVGGASNAIGTINDLQRVAKIAKDANALFFVDAVHLAPHELIDVQTIGCDFLACSAYKFYGPHVGILYGRYELLDTLPFPKLAPAPDRAPERVETGTQNHEGIAGVAATIDFLASLGGEHGTRRERLGRAYEQLHEQGAKLTQMLWDALKGMARVRIYGPPPTERRTPTISFTVKDTHCDDLSRAFAAKGLFASSGDFYAATVCERFGIESLLRIGAACYTTEEEVRRLIDAIAAE